MSNITLRWLEGALMVGTDSTGHSIVIGKSPEDKSTFIGVKPSDLLLLAAASCSAYDVVEILQKQREPLSGLTVNCQGDQLKQTPYKFTKMHLHYKVMGAVNPKKLERAIKLSMDKYCSVINSLRPGVEVSSDYEILG
jgi:putative redox protein